MTSEDIKHQFIIILEAHTKHFASDVIRFPTDKEKVNHKVLNMVWTADYSELLSFISSSSFLCYIF